MVEGLVEMSDALEGAKEVEVENEVVKGVKIVVGNRCEVVDVAIDFVPKMGKGIAERKHGMDEMGVAVGGGEVEFVRSGCREA